MVCIYLPRHFGTADLRQDLSFHGFRPGHGLGDGRVLVKVALSVCQAAVGGVGSNRPPFVLRPFAVEGQVHAQVYLGVLAVAGFLIVQQVASGWERGLAGVVTVQLPPSERGDEDVSAALEVLRATPGVASAERVADDEMQDLLSPWLRGTEIAGELPLPRLINVDLAPARLNAIDGGAAPTEDI